MKGTTKVFAIVGLLAAAGSANAQLSIYGLVDICYGKSLLGDVFLGEKADIHSGGDNGNSECNSTTRVGVKGSQDIGSGAKINFKFESNGITSDGRVNSPTVGRAAWLGLSGNFGELRVGRQDAVPDQVMSDFDFNGKSNGVSAGAYTGVGVWARGRQSRSIQYISPTFGGLTGQVGVRPEGNSQDGDKTVFSLGAKYAVGPLLVGASLQTKTDSSVKDDFFSVAASYDLGFAKFMVGVADGGKASQGGSGKGYTLGAMAPFAGFTFGGHYAANTDSNLKLKSFELFVNREIFKNTYAYVEGGQWKTSLSFNPLDPAAKTKGTGYSLGVIYVF
jgi:predicted porin